MNIEGIEFEFGSRFISNNTLIDCVRAQSSECGLEELNKIIKHISFYLGHCGSKSRYWLDSNESAIELIKNSSNRLLRNTGYSKSDIDFVIHVGLGRGFIEPAQAYFVANAVGMLRANCFDIVDACNSWTRGLQLAYALLHSNPNLKIMIINTECNMQEGGIINPRLLSFKSASEVEHSFAGLTLTDACAATLVTGSDNPWHFTITSRPDLSNICAVPLQTFQNYSTPSSLLAINGINQFTCFAKKMNQLGKPEIIQIMNNNIVPDKGLKKIFPHGHSQAVWPQWFDELNISQDLLGTNIFENYGNAASACLPIAIKMALDSGEIQKGDFIATILGSGGMAFSSMKFCI